MNAADGGKQVNDYIEKVAEKLGKLDYAQRGKILREVVQNMNERADSSQDMAEIAAFLVAQLGGDADEVVEGHLPREAKYVGPDIASGKWN